MVYALTCKISFPESRGREAFILRRIEGVEVEKSVKSLVDKAIVKIPRKRYFSAGINARIQTGDSIKIELGYNGNLEKSFEGYVVRVKADTTVEIFCEDEMWKLKQSTVHKIMRRVELEKLLKEIAPAYEVKAANFQLGDVKMTRTTPLAVLENLKSNYNINCFFDDKTLVGGMPYSYRSGVIPITLGEYQLPINLEYQSEAELKVKIRAQSLLANGTKHEVTVGDEHGAESKLVYSNIESKAELKKMAEADLTKLKRGGYKGDFEVMGFVSVLPGMKVELNDIFYTERAGRYHVDAVKTMWGATGFHKNLKLGLRL